MCIFHFSHPHTHTHLRTYLYICYILKQTPCFHEHITLISMNLQLHLHPGSHAAVESMERHDKQPPLVKRNGAWTSHKDECFHMNLRAY